MLRRQLLAEPNWHVDEVVHSGVPFDDEVEDCTGRKLLLATRWRRKQRHYGSKVAVSKERQDRLPGGRRQRVVVSSIARNLPLLMGRQVLA